MVKIHFLVLQQKGQAPIKEGGGGEDGHEFWDDAGNEKVCAECCAVCSVLNHVLFLAAAGARW